MAAKDGAFVVLFRDDIKQEVFLVLRSDYTIWNLTGGGIEKEEKPETAAIREAWEETGFKVRLVNFAGVYYFSDKSGKPTRKTYLYEGRVISGEFKPEFPGCRGKWFPINRLPVSITKQGREKIKDAVFFDGKEFKKDKIEQEILENWHLLFLHPLSAIKFLLRK